MEGMDFTADIIEDMTGIRPNKYVTMVKREQISPSGESMFQLLSWQKMNLFREMKRYMENSLIQAAVHGGTLSKILLIN